MIGAWGCCASPGTTSELRRPGRRCCSPGPEAVVSLAVGRSSEAVDDTDSAWRLVTSESCLHVRDHHVFIKVDTCLSLDNSDYRLPETIVRYADDNGVLHR